MCFPNGGYKGRGVAYTLKWINTVGWIVFKQRLLSSLFFTHQHESKTKAILKSGNMFLKIPAFQEKCDTLQPAGKCSHLCHFVSLPRSWKSFNMCKIIEWVSVSCWGGKVSAGHKQTGLLFIFHSYPKDLWFKFRLKILQKKASKLTTFHSQNNNTQTTI